MQGFKSEDDEIGFVAAKAFCGGDVDVEAIVPEGVLDDAGLLRGSVRVETEDGVMMDAGVETESGICVVVRGAFQ